MSASLQLLPVLLLLVLPLVLPLEAASHDWFKVLDSCGDVACVRARVDMALDRALNTTSIPLTEGVSLVRRDPPEPPAQLVRGDQDVLSKFIRLVTSRNINIQLSNLNEARGKKKKYIEYLYVAALVAAVVIPMKLQGLALVAGKALLIAKVALALAGAALLKKLGHDEHHRRVDVEGDPYLLAYREHT